MRGIDSVGLLRDHADARDVNTPHRVASAHKGTLSAKLTYLGLLTLSWDRIAAIPVKTYHLKLPYICFALAVLVSVVSDRRLPSKRTNPVVPVYGSIALVMVLYLLAVLFGVSKSAGISQVITVVGGALLPFCAVLRVARRQGGPHVLFRWLIRGGCIAALFGLYQLIAFYVHLPQGVAYTGQVGGFGRIAGMSYEPAYFADYMVLVIAAILAYRRVRDIPTYRRTLLLCVASLVLSNSRATLIMVPVFVFAFRPQVLRSLRRKAFIRSTMVLALILGLFAAFSPLAMSHLEGRVISIANLNEPTSNAPRLKQYRAEIAIIRDHPVSGIGPGGLYKEAAKYGWDVPSSWGPNQVVANNVWLQSAVDGGIVLFVAEMVLLVSVALVVRRRPSAPVQLLWAGWFAVILVGGFLTSIYFEIELWVVLGLLLGCVLAGSPQWGVTSVGARSAGGRNHTFLYGSGRRCESSGGTRYVHLLE